MTAAKIMDVIARLPGCDGQTDYGVSAYTQVKWEDARRMLKIPQPECPDVWVRLPRHLWPIFMGKHWRSRGTSWTKLVWSPICGLLWERQFEEALLELEWEKVQNWECMFVLRNIMAGNEAEYGSHMEEDDEKCGDWRTHIISGHVHLGCTQRECKPECNSYRTKHEDVWFTHFCWSHGKITGVAKTSRANCRWHGRTCSKNALSDIVNWQTKKWSNCTKSQVLDEHQFNQEELESVGELSEVCLTNCLEMLVFGTNGTTWHSMVGQQACKSSHKMDSGMRQTIDKTDFSHSLQIRFRQRCHVGITAQHCGLVCSKSQTLLVTLRTGNQPQEVSCDFLEVTTFSPISWICKKQASVSHSSTESEIISLDAGLRMDGIPALDLLGHSDWSTTFNQQHCPTQT